VQKLTKWGLCVLALIAAFALGRGERVYTETDLPAHGKALTITVTTQAMTWV